MSAHTPWPIRMRDVGDAHCLYFGNHGRPFATMYHANMPREEASRLMATLAAAPELLAALREAVTSLEYAVAALQAPERCAMRENIADARAAIAKAEGRS